MQQGSVSALQQVQGPHVPSLKRNSATKNETKSVRMKYNYIQHKCNMMSKIVTAFVTQAGCIGRHHSHGKHNDEDDEK